MDFEGYLRARKRALLNELDEINRQLGCPKRETQREKRSKRHREQQESQHRYAPLVSSSAAITDNSVIAAFLFSLRILS